MSDRSCSPNSELRSTAQLARERETSHSADDHSHSSITDRIIARVKEDQCAYVGIYKPGELGRMTWRAVLLDTHRRGRGYRGKWESVVLSTPERKGIDNLVDKVERMSGPKAVRHIVNPHCDQDEGLRIVWSDNGEEEDWSRRDRMMRAGKTVKAEERVEYDEHAEGLAPAVEQFGVWDNTVWTSLRSPM